MNQKPKGIDLSTLTENHIGRQVVYRTAPEYRPEQGRITAFSHSYIFVDYNNSGLGVATDPRDLDFI